MKQPIRQLQIPNLINKDILEDIIFDEEKKISFEYDFSPIGIGVLMKELGLNSNTGTFEYIKNTTSPLEKIKNTLEGKIIDAIENNTFRFIENNITIKPFEGLVTIDCKLQLVKKF